MSENPTQKCPRCGAEIGPAGVCPRCAADFLQASATESAAAGEGKHGFVPPSPAELQEKFPQLEMLGFIGQGGMGAVYQARQRQLERVVALKILPPGIGEDPAFAERFAREAKAMAKLNHPGIVTVHDFGRADGLFYFLMEFVDGVSLAQLIQAGRVSPREALAIVPQICDALQYAHDQGLVHRDIKPENILLDRRGRVKVADFGLVKLMEGTIEPAAAESSGGPPALTQAGKVLGTPRYMAPEQVAQPTEVDHRADIYALGVVFYQMLTGELPGKPLQPPSKKVQVDVRLDEVVLHALEQEPERRYQQASQIKTAVETVASTPLRSKESERIPLVPTSLPRMERSKQPQPSRPLVRGLLWVASLLLGLGLLAFGGSWFAYRRHQVSLPPSTPLRVLAYATERGNVRVYLTLPGSVVSSNAVDFSISQSWVQTIVQKFRADEKLPVIAYSSQGDEFGHGLVMGVDNKMEPQTGTLRCTARLVPEQANLMIPGMYLNVHMLGEVKHDVIRVPAEAVERIQDSTFVWAVTRQQTVTRKRVIVGTIEDSLPTESEILRRLMARRAAESTNEPVESISAQWAEIHDGLSPGELVIVRGQDDLLKRHAEYGWKVRPELVKVVEPPEIDTQSAATTDQTNPAGLQSEIPLNDNRELLQAQYHQAETEFARLEKLHDAKAISDAEFEAAKEKTEALKATLEGDQIRAAQIKLESAERSLQRVSLLFTNNLVSISEVEAAQLEVQKRRAELKEADARTLFAPFFARTLRINGDQCDFLVLRTGEVLHHSVDVADVRDETPPTEFMQWVRSNRVDLGFCFSTNKFYPSFGLFTFDMGTYQFPSDTVPLAMIPRFSSVAEWETYNAQNAVPAEHVLIGPLVGVTNIWEDLKAAQLEDPPDGPAFFLSEKHFALCFTCTNVAPIAFSTRDGLRGLLQVTGFDESPPALKLRYRLLSRGTPVQAAADSASIPK